MFLKIERVTGSDQSKELPNDNDSGNSSEGNDSIPDQTVENDSVIQKDSWLESFTINPHLSTAGGYYVIVQESDGIITYKWVPIGNTSL